MFIPNIYWMQFWWKILRISCYFVALVMKYLVWYVVIYSLQNCIPSWIEFEDKNITKYQQADTKLLCTLFSIFTNTIHFFHSSRILLVVEISCTTKFCIVQWRLQRIKERVNASQEIFHSFFLSLLHSIVW